MSVLVTLTSGDRFPAGVSVSAFPVSNWGQAQLPPAGAPVGASVATAVVGADGSLALTGLAEDSRFVAYALVGGQHRYVAFSTLRPRATGAAVTTTFEPAGTIAASDVQAAIEEVAVEAGSGGADASSTVKGITELSVDPVSATVPIAVGTNDSRMTNARTPTAHHASHEPGGTDAMAVDAVVATGSLRTLGSGAQQASAGTHTHTITLDTDATLAANSDAVIASQKAVKGYVDTASGLLIPKSLIDAKGDLLVGTADNTAARLAVGANDTALTADSTATTGAKWSPRVQIPSVPSGQLMMADGPAANVVMANLVHRGLTLSVPRATSFVGAAIFVVTGTVTAAVRMGCFALDETTGAPGALISDFGSVPATAAGLQENVITLTLAAGLYVLSAFVFGAATSPTLRAQSTGIIGGPGIADMSAHGGYNTASIGASNTMPSTFGTASIVVNCPIVALRRA